MTRIRQPSIPSEITYKVVALNIGSAMGALFMLVLGATAFMQGHLWLGTADLITTGIVALNSVYLRRTGDCNRVKINRELSEEIARHRAMEEELKTPYDTTMSDDLPLSQKCLYISMRDTA